LQEGKKALIQVDVLVYIVYDGFGIRLVLFDIKDATGRKGPCWQLVQGR